MSPKKGFKLKDVETPNHFLSDKLLLNVQKNPCLASPTKYEYTRRGAESAKNLLTGALTYRGGLENERNLTPNSVKKITTLRQIEKVHDNFSSSTNLPLLNKHIMNLDVSPITEQENPFEQGVYSVYSPVKRVRHVM